MIYQHRTFLCYGLLIIGLSITAKPYDLYGQTAQQTVLANARFEQQLEVLISTRWDLPLKDVLNSISETQRVAIFLDRRINPAQQIQLAIQGKTMSTALQQIANQANAQISHVRNVIYVGPKKTTHLLATVAAIHAEQHRRNQAENTRVFTIGKSTQWNRLSQPQSIVTAIAETVNARITNIETIPFDLWDKHTLPNLPFAMRMSIVLAGFDLTYQVNNDRSITLIPFPTEAKYLKAFSTNVNAANLNRIKNSFPTLQITNNNGQLVASGRWEEIDELERLLQGNNIHRPKPTTTSKQVYTLTVTNQTIQNVLQAIAINEKLKLVATAKAQEIWNKRISLEVKELPLADLLLQVAGQGNLQYRIADKQLLITVKM
ncbi:MAG: hypothetical protein HN617_02140 [Planctomycetaceae bacterium]|jgi:hypothetical protein|nr:hypothetical protein [Planctomycetaceae bacterium]MBT4013619.1 hypothetical protein [Planctomycetaceae bacterium]MBT4725047.1 hypothetical protein [Planctomycetaceae bacterium]MBT5123050.1 hypothetical protein [Planctomycetaceae bacterium]MBT5599544.1 hypothetical protein [Planctomycetaceae bacterium]